MRIARLIAILCLVMSGTAWGQGVPQQAGPWAPGRVPMYVGSGAGQASIQDSGPAAGGRPGIGLSELGITARGTGTPPYAGTGTGQFGTNLCDYDAPTTNAGGFHYLCLSPNAQGGGLITYGAAGAASVMPLKIVVNGTAYSFPFAISGITGPPSSVAGHVALFANTTGNLLSDSGFALGGSAALNVGTTAGTVAAGNDGRITNSVQHGGDAGDATVTRSGTGAVSESLVTTLSRAIYVEQFAPHRNFTQDDGVAANNAVAAAVSAGGGTVVFGPYSYWIDQNFTVPKGVTIACVGYSGKLTVGLNFQNAPCSLYFAPGFQPTIQGKDQEVNLFADLVHFTNVGTTRAAMEAYVASFAGAGLQIGASSDTGGIGNDASIQNVMIGGFSKCININYALQVVLTDVLTDCTNGTSIDHSYDDDRLTNVQQWEFLTTNQAHTFDSWSITAAADNGSGLWRLTLGSASDITTGEQLWVGRGTGAEGTGGQWAVTVVDSTHVDLQGSATAPATTGNTTAGLTYIAVASTANLQPGMTVSGTGIPAGAAIGAVWRTRNAISLDQSHPATATGSGVTLTFGSNAYTPGSTTLAYDGTWRTGTGFDIARADGMTCAGCFAFGSQIGFNLHGAIGQDWRGTQVDALSHVPNQNAVPIGIEFTGTQTYGNVVSGPLITSGGVSIISNATNTGGSYSNTVSGFRPADAYQYGTAVEIAAGAMIVSGLQDGSIHSILIDNAAYPPVMTGNQLQATSIYPVNVQANWVGAGNSFGGLLQHQYPPTIGGRSVMIAAPSTPVLNFYDAAQATDSKYWRGAALGGTFCIQSANDAYSATSNAVCATRSGNTVTGVQTTGVLTVGGLAGTAAQQVCVGVNGALYTHAPGGC